MLICSRERINRNLLRKESVFVLCLFDYRDNGERIDVLNGENSGRFWDFHRNDDQYRDKPKRTKG